MKLTALRSGLFIVSVNGQDVSRHMQEREAIEAAVNRENAKPSDDVRYRHECEVKVEAAAPMLVKMVALTGLQANMNNEWVTGA